jgi:hypothetical protein
MEMTTDLELGLLRSLVASAVANGFLLHRRDSQP